MTTTETTQAPPREFEHAPEIPSKNLPPVGYKDLPDAPPLRRILGPIRLRGPVWRHADGTPAAW